ncbi:MAG: Ig-like protein [Verrucomicrobiales bacterium]|nr:Ig-like protein [Verrucomicrobiales bacterium]
MKKQFLPSARSCILPAFYLAMRSLAPAVTTVPGTLINVDFNGSGGAGGSTNPITFDGNLAENATTAASIALEDADAALNDFWNGFNQINQTNQPLLDSSGAATAATVSWSGFDGTYTNYLNGRDGSALLERTDGPNGDGHLLFGAGAARSGTVIVGGLDATRTYDFVAIGGGSDPVSFSIAGTTLATGEWGSVNNPSNWCLFPGVVPDGSGKITLTVSTNGTNNFGVGGFQLTAVGSALDADNDGLPDTWEDLNGFDSGNPADGSPIVSALTDPDGDTLPNITEYTNNTDPRNPDTDTDGLPDNVETNTKIWVGPTNTGTSPLKRDSDGDSLPDIDENLDAAQGSDPNKRDTDGDGFTDPEEILAGTNPKDPNSSLRRTVPGRLVNYDFNGDVNGLAALTSPITFDGNLTRDPSTAASVAFADGFSTVNDVWNGAEGMEPQSVFEGVPQTLVDSTGAPSPLTLVWSGFGYNYTNYTNGRDSGGGFTSGPNGDGFFATGGAQPTVTIQNLDPAVTYEIAAIAAGDPVKFILGTEEKVIQMWDSSLNAATWAVFSDIIPDASGNVVLTVASINAQRNFGIGGLQISVPSTAPTPDFKITGIARDATTGDISLTWTAATGKNYAVLWSATLTNSLEPVAGELGIAGTGGSITRTFPAPVAGAGKLFFRVKEY